MADYYSQHDPRRGAGQGRLDYDDGSTGRWIWAALILVAVVGLIALGSIGAGDGDRSESVPAATAEGTMGGDAPAAADSSAGAEVVPIPDASLGAEAPADGEAQPAPPAPAE